MKLKPARKGLKVINPVTGQRIPEDGFELMKMNTYWFRALQCGDVVEVQEKPQELPAQEEKTKSGGAKK